MRNGTTLRRENREALPVPAGVSTLFASTGGLVSCVGASALCDASFPSADVVVDRLASIAAPRFLSAVLLFAVICLVLLWSPRVCSCRDLPGPVMRCVTLVRALSA